ASPALPAPTRSSSAPATSPWGYSRTPSAPAGASGANHRNPPSPRNTLGAGAALVGDRQAGAHHRSGYRSRLRAATRAEPLEQAARVNDPLPPRSPRSRRG